ncbi:Conserved_hypothetical protein [Hexamita inflata]|uniref:Uncharacterized protein n=1 Tax=Hexamita inflata TaxID=28002 RepID=A0ABP1HCC6_9EUKA
MRQIPKRLQEQRLLAITFQNAAKFAGKPIPVQEIVFDAKASKQVEQNHSGLHYLVQKAFTDYISVQDQLFKSFQLKSSAFGVQIKELNQKLIRIQNENFKLKQKMVEMESIGIFKISDEIKKRKTKIEFELNRLKELVNEK